MKGFSKFLLIMFVFNLFTFSCSMQSPSTGGSQEDLSDYNEYITASGESVYIPKTGYTTEDITQILASFENPEEIMEHNPQLDSDTIMKISPGDTRRYDVTVGYWHSHYTSTNGYRTFNIWLIDDQAIVRAVWLENRRGSSGWITVKRETISEKYIRYSQTVHLRPLERFKISVYGIRQSNGETNKSKYMLSCQ